MKVVYLLCGLFMLGTVFMGCEVYTLGILFYLAVIGLGYYAIDVNWLAPKREAKEKLERKFQEQKKREQDEYQLAHTMGLMKFYKMNSEDVRRYKEGVEAIAKLGAIMQQSVYQEKEKDWAVLGGIAEGIAGPLAGVATAVEAINDNAKIQAENAARREWGARQKAHFIDLATQAAKDCPEELSMADLEAKYETNYAWAPSTLFNLLIIYDYKAKIDIDEETKAVIVSIPWEQYDSTICIDGSLRAKIYYKNKCVGCAYLNLPKIGTAKLYGRISGICTQLKPVDNTKINLSSVEDVKSLEVKIEPADLWELAAKGNVLPDRGDNLTVEEHRKLVAENEFRYTAEL